MESYLEQVVEGTDLTQAEAESAVTAVFEDATDAQIGALLAGLRAKGETEAEIAGFAEGMRAAARQIDPDRELLVDTCGTGGDGHDTINVSTTSALVAAAAGVPVAKHGNYSVSSSSGSADVLDAVGVTVDAAPETVEATIEDIGIGFMLAPVFHPAMKAVIGPRKELGMRTIFNVLGPLTNPANADAQVVGVYSPELVETLARALTRMDVTRALVVYGSGLDEIAVHDTTQIAEVTGDTYTRYEVTPADIGLQQYPLETIAGSTPEANAADLEGILTGEITGGKRAIILANAGAALYVADVVPTLAAGVDLARETIDNGLAAETLRRLQEAG